MSCSSAGQHNAWNGGIFSECINAEMFDRLNASMHKSVFVSEQVTINMPDSCVTTNALHTKQQSWPWNLHQWLMYECWNTYSWNMTRVKLLSLKNRFVANQQLWLENWFSFKWGKTLLKEGVKHFIAKLTLVYVSYYIIMTCYIMIATLNVAMHKSVFLSEQVTINMPDSCMTTNALHTKQQSLPVKSAPMVNVWMLER